MSDKIIFNWTLFSNVELRLSKTEEIVIREHFNIWVKGNPDNMDCSSPEMKARFNIFKSSWIMSQMFTDK
jgi:hypothetical protein